MKKIICAMTCSPRQSTFMSIVKVDSTGGVSEVALRIPATAAREIYGSIVKHDWVLFYYLDFLFSRCI